VLMGILSFTDRWLVQGKGLPAQGAGRPWRL